MQFQWLVSSEQLLLSFIVTYMNSRKLYRSGDEKKRKHETKERRSEDENEESGESSDGISLEVERVNVMSQNLVASGRAWIKAVFLGFLRLF